MSNWRSYFGYSPTDAVTAADLRAKYRRLALRLHPNKGGSTANFQALGQMQERALKNLARPAAATASAAAAAHMAGKRRCPPEAHRMLGQTRCAGRYLDSQCQVKCGPVASRPQPSRNRPQPQPPRKRPQPQPSRKRPQRPRPAGCPCSCRRP